MTHTVRAHAAMGLVMALPLGAAVWSAYATVSGLAALAALDISADPAGLGDQLTLDQILLPVVLAGLTLALAWFAAVAAAGCRSAAHHLAAGEHPNAGEHPATGEHLAAGHEPAGQGTRGGTGHTDSRSRPAAGRQSGITAAVAALVVLLAGAGPARAAVDPNPVTVVVSGDSAGHDIDETSVDGPTDDAPGAVAGWTPRVMTTPPASSRLVVGVSPAATNPVTTAPAPQTRGHVVTHGECLWSIAAAGLGPAASAAEIAAEWPRWWQANHAVIGDDPDLILPGQTLYPPG